MNKQDLKDIAELAGITIGIFAPIFIYGWLMMGVITQYLAGL